MHFLNLLRLELEPQNSSKTSFCKQNQEVNEALTKNSKNKDNIKFSRIESWQNNQTWLDGKQKKIMEYCGTKKIISNANYFHSLTFGNSVIRLLKRMKKPNKNKKARIGRICTRKIVIIEVSTISSKFIVKI